MLSGESAVGSYPVDAVAMLARIAAATEPHRRPITPKDLFGAIDLKDKIPAARLTDLAIDTVLEYSSRAFVFARTHSGKTARSIARLRPSAWIIAVSSREQACQQMQFSFGVQAVHETEPPKEWSSYARNWLDAQGLQADLIVLAQGPAAESSDGTYRMEILDLRQSRGNTESTSASGLLSAAATDSSN
jgi:pyruvate kinase